MPLDESTHDIIDQHCWNCGYKFEQATALTRDDHNRPAPGDVTVCIKCASLSVFTDSAGNMRAITDEDIAELEQNKEQWRKLVALQVSILGKLKTIDGHGRYNV